MAINKSNTISGLIGPVVVYKLHGKEVVRSRPRKHTKSEASQKAAKEFGLASKISAQLRRDLRKSLQGLAQPNTRYRFSSAIQQWLHNGKPDMGSSAPGFLFIEEFQFNEKTSLTEKMKVRFSVDWSQPGKILVNIPALIPTRDIAAPQNTESIQCMIEVAGASPDDEGSHDQYACADIDIPYNPNPVGAQTLEIVYPVKTGQLVVAVLALHYVLNKNGDRKPLNDLKWLPVGVIGNYYIDKAL